MNRFTSQPDSSGLNNLANQQQPERFVDANALAEHLSVTCRQILEMTRRGVIPGHPLGIGASRRVWRYKISEVEAALASGIRKPSAPLSLTYWPVEMDETLAALLRAWRQQTPYSKDSDFLFPSFKLHGKQPRIGSMIVQDYIRPAAVAAGVIPEDCPRFGFHNLRHGLSTFLIENGHDPVVVQRMLRQSHVDMTMHYVHNSHKARNAQAQFIERFLPNGGAVTDAEEPNDAERVPVQVVRVQ